MGAAAQTVLNDLTSELVLPLIALAEAVDIVEKGRTKIASVADLLSDVLSDPRFILQSLTLAILQAGLQARAVPEMHDRLIVATGLHWQSLSESVAILTKDTSIVTAALLPVVWN